MMQNTTGINITSVGHLCKGTCNVTSPLPAVADKSTYDKVLDGLEIANYILLPSLLAFGITGNTLTIIVMNTKRYQQLTSRMFLIALAVSDSLLLITQPFNKMFVVKLFGIDVRALSQVGCKLFFFFCRTGKMTSSWFVVFICLERFVAVWFPLKAKIIWNKKLAICVIVAIYILIGTFNAVWTYSSQVLDDGFCYPDYFDKSDPSEVQWYKSMLTTASSIYSFIPITILVTVSLLILAKLGQQRRKRMNMTNSSMKNDQSTKTTVMLMSIVIAYFILVMPITVLHNISFYIGVKAFGNNSASFLIFRNVAQILEQVNYSINFIMYVVASQQFRAGLKSVPRLERYWNLLTRLSITRTAAHSSPTMQRNVKDTTDNDKCWHDVNGAKGIDKEGKIYKH